MLINLTKFKSLIFAVLFICITCSNAQSKTYKVIRVADGDTITIQMVDQKVRVRLIG